MSSTPRFAFKALMLLSLAFYVSCSSTDDGIQPTKPEPVDPNDPTGQTPDRELSMWEYLENDKGNQFTILLKVLEDAGLKDELDTGVTQKTLFAVLDRGFNEFIAREGFQSSAEFYSAEALPGILSYHLVSNALITVERMPADGEYLTPAGNRLFVQKNEQFGTWINGNARIVTQDIVTKNGVIHVVDDVVEPPTKSMYQYLDDLGEFTTFLGLMEDFNLASILNNPGQRTVFAPTDDAFATLIDFRGQEVFFQNMTPREQISLLLNHVILDTKFSYEFADGADLQTFDTDRDRKVRALLANNGDIYVNGFVADDKGIDYRATNGAVHIVDDVLIPTPTVVDRLYFNQDRFSFLYAALDATGLDATLDDLDEITLFAPTDQGMKDSLNAWFGVNRPSDIYDLGATEMATLSEYLQYHVLLSARTSVNLVNTHYYPTALVPALQFLDNGASLQIKDANLNRVELGEIDYEAGNGYVHELEGPLVPPSANLMDKLREVDEFKFLVDAIVAAGLDGVLSDESRTFTIIAPTTNAIADVTMGAPETLAEMDTDTLAQILGYHVIEGGRYHSNDLLSAEFLSDAVFDDDLELVVPIMTVEGSSINWTVQTSLMKENGEFLEDPADTPAHGWETGSLRDIISTNGVIHGWTGVMFP